MTIKIDKWSTLFFILLLADIVYTYLQSYYTMNLDGDLCAIIMPSQYYQRVLTDPFGMGVLLKGESYAASNRFFIHWFMKLYLRNVPLFLQNFTSPVESVYIAMAIMRTAMNVGITFLIAAFACGPEKIFGKKYLLAALLVIPFFQVAGYNNEMGITFSSITYSCFYGLPFIFILAYFLPFYKYLLRGNYHFTLLTHLWLFALLLIIAFGGPLGPPVVMLVCSAVLFYLFIRNLRKIKSGSVIQKITSAIRNIPGAVLFHFLIALLICAYSYYVGSHNSENDWVNFDLKERFKLLPEGFWKIFSFKLGLPLLIAMPVLNAIIISRRKDAMAKNIVLLVKAAGILCFLYILLLPLGGYRTYRPLIIRHDTFSPVTVTFMLLYGISCVYLIFNSTPLFRKIYSLVMVAMIFIYTNADRIDLRGNECEKSAIQYYSEQPGPIVHMPHWCNMMAWNRITNYHDSDLNTDLFKLWHVVDEKKYYYYD